MCLRMREESPEKPEWIISVLHCMRTAVTLLVCCSREEWKVKNQNLETTTTTSQFTGHLFTDSCAHTQTHMNTHTLRETWDGEHEQLQ